MTQFILHIEDKDDTVVVQASINPPLTDDKTEFTTAEVLGLYLREHMADILNAAVQWAIAAEQQQQPNTENNHD